MTEPNCAEMRALEWDVVNHVGHGGEVSCPSTLQTRYYARELRRTVHTFPQ